MEKSVKSNAVTLGITAGVILALVTVIGYVAYQDMYTQWWIGILLFIMTVIFGIVSSIKSRKLLGGFITYKTAFTSYLLTIVIGTIISSIVSILIFVVIDPEAAQGINEKIIETSVQFMERFGAPEAEIEKAVQKMQETNQFSIASHIKSWFWGILFYSIIGLLSSLAVKKKENQF